MASTIGATGENAMIPLIPRIDPIDMPTVTLTRTVMAAGINDKRKAVVNHVSDGMEVEPLLRLVRDYRQTWSAGRLALTTGQLRFDYFRQCLSGIARDRWDVEATAVGGTTIANFATCIDNWLSRYISPTDLADQRRYLETTKKPRRLTCESLSGRLEYLNQLLAVVPNSGGVPYTEQDLKMKFFNMMLEDWQVKFAASGIELMSPGYSLRQLTRYMSVQEIAYNRSRDNSERRRSRRGGRGRDSRGGSRSSRGTSYRRFDGGSTSYPPSQRARTPSGRGARGYGYGYNYGYSNYHPTPSYVTPPASMNPPYAAKGAGRQVVQTAPARGRGGYSRGSYGRGGRGRGYRTPATYWQHQVSPAVEENQYYYEPEEPKSYGQWPGGAGVEDDSGPPLEEAAAGETPLESYYEGPEEDLQEYDY